MVITIQRGDEHRAKIEHRFSEEDFFADVYTRADTLVGEITQELKAYQNERKNNKNDFFAYHGMENNVVIFCGERGQGKTSAMQSFVRYLDGTHKREDADGNSKALVLGRSGNNVYEMIDTIDPSAMENEESVLRVLISRLFFRLERHINKSVGQYGDDNNFVLKRKKIVDLFQKCYNNIDFIKSGRMADYEQDDLDTLSQLGSSAKLKANMHDLIETYLDMISDKESKEEKKDRYLVIPIDDADLATKKVFQLCEDIRNYLSLPNVIILMAADYGQLVQAAYQRYLKQYKVMWKAEKISGHKMHIVDECHEMAAKYLEKVFPVTHRIDLPRIDYMLMEGYRDVTFRYMVAGEDGKPVSAFDKLYSKECSDLQEQLLELLYKRTGLVFVGKNRRMHLFLPNTLRELAHWVKMLYDMHDIDCDAVYQKYQSFHSVDADAALLKENILRIKQYFMNYWCEKNLDISAVKVLQKIDSATRRKQMAEVKNVLYGYHGHIQKSTDATYQEIIHSLVEQNFEGESYFREAVSIYYTIFLNEWFAAALKDRSQFDAIVCFVERAVYLSDYKDKKYWGKYNIMQFDVNVSALREILEDDIGQSAYKCLKSFCAAVKNNKIIENIHVADIINKKFHPNAEIDSLEFNVFRPFLTLLKENTDEVKESNEETDPADGEDSTGDKATVEEVRHFRMPYLVTVRNIIANCDGQWQVRKAVDSWYENNAEEGGLFSLSEQLPKIYEKIGQEVRTPKGGEDGKIDQIYKDTGAEDNKNILEQLFLCNLENVTNYVSALDSSLGELQIHIDNEQKGFNVKSIPDEDDAMNELYSKFDNLLGKIEERYSQVTIGEDKLGKIASMLLPAENDVKWENIENKCQKINGSKNQLEIYRTAIENKKAQTAAGKDSGQPTGEQEGQQPDTNQDETEFGQMTLPIM